MPEANEIQDLSIREIYVSHSPFTFTKILDPGYTQSSTYNRLRFILLFITVFVDVLVFFVRHEKSVAGDGTASHE